MHLWETTFAQRNVNNRLHGFTKYENWFLLVSHFSEFSPDKNGCSGVDTFDVRGARRGDREKIVATYSSDGR